MTHIASAIAMLSCAYCLYRADAAEALLGKAAWAAASALCVAGACVVWEVWG